MFKTHFNIYEYLYMSMNNHAQNASICIIQHFYTTTITYTF
nr:MAG TPA: hypothetical protein [Caudoviricetes sp.]